MYQLTDVRVYTYKERLGNVITVPLVHKKTFTFLRMIPIPVPVNREHFLYVDVRDSVLCLERARQYYFTMTEDELPKVQVSGARLLSAHTPTHAVIHPNYGFVHSDNGSEEE